MKLSITILCHICHSDHSYLEWIKITLSKLQIYVVVRFQWQKSWKSGVSFKLMTPLSHGDFNYFSHPGFLYCLRFHRLNLASIYCIHLIERSQVCFFILQSLFLILEFSWVFQVAHKCQIRPLKTDMVEGR